jgi:hypothetical protein
MEITVKVLREQLEKLEALGYADSPLVYMDRDSMTYELEEGIHDIWYPLTANGVAKVVLG